MLQAQMVVPIPMHKVQIHSSLDADHLPSCMCTEMEQAHRILPLWHKINILDS